MARQTVDSRNRKTEDKTKTENFKCNTTLDKETLGYFAKGIQAVL